MGYKMMIQIDRSATLHKQNVIQKGDYAMYKYTFEFGFTDYDNCDYQEIKVEISSPVNLHNLFPAESSGCNDVVIARLIVECSHTYNPYSVLHTDFFRFETIKKECDLNEIE